MEKKTCEKRIKTKHISLHNENMRVPEKEREKERKKSSRKMVWEHVVDIIATALFFRPLSMVYVFNDSYAIHIWIEKKTPNNQFTVSYLSEILKIKWAQSLPTYPLPHHQHLNANRNCNILNIGWLSVRMLGRFIVINFIYFGCFGCSS